MNGTKATKLFVELYAYIPVSLQERLYQGAPPYSDSVP